MSSSFPAIVFVCPPPILLAISLTGLAKKQPTQNTANYILEFHQVAPYVEQQTSITVLHQPWGPSRFRFLTVHFYTDNNVPMTEAREALTQSLNNYYPLTNPMIQHPAYGAILCGLRITFYRYRYETGELEALLAPEQGLWGNMHLFWDAASAFAFLDFVKKQIEEFFGFP
ncbi:hypothetical protein PHISCL_01678 [Aspergillus sclerotialis]|uniref:Uncharacterized protein n=1 Tax=Aspergillus sclerotialis TaxID=2070753 RepID=A0A3A2ZUI7_9EURO|nr:hypothetical protein PHISCL_01678 [Aspergillus sclerotialis]